MGRHPPLMVRIRSSIIWGLVVLLVCVIGGLLISILGPKILERWGLYYEETQGVFAAFGYLLIIGAITGFVLVWLLPRRSGFEARLIISRYLSDHPTTEDRLGFSIYVDALAKTVSQSRPEDRPLIVGVYGPWGSGKTSLMRMIGARLQYDHNYHVIWLSAWKYAKEDELWAALIQAVLSHLKLAGNPSQRLANHVRLRWRSIRWKAGAWDLILQLSPTALKTALLLLGLLLIAFPSRGLVAILPLLGLQPTLTQVAIQTINLTSGAALTTFGLAISRIWELFSDQVKLDLDAYRRKDKFREHVAFLDEFADEFAYLVGIATQPHRPLVVMIDDLDRCLPEKAVSVLEALKLFVGDRTNCIFFIGADREFIEQAILVRYKDFTQVGLAGPSFGRDYLEKVVQLPFVLPPLGKENIAAFIRKAPYDQQTRELAQMFSYGLEPNPRQVKRVLRVFQLYREFAVQRAQLTGAHFELSILAIVTMIQYRWPDVFLTMARVPEFLGLLQDSFSAEVPEEYKEKAISDDLRATVEKFMSYHDLKQLLLCEGSPRLFGEDLSQYVFITEISGLPVSYEVPWEPKESRSWPWARTDTEVTLGERKVHALKEVGREVSSVPKKSRLWPWSPTGFKATPEVKAHALKEVGEFEDQEVAEAARAQILQAESPDQVQAAMAMAVELNVNRVMERVKQAISQKRKVYVRYRPDPQGPVETHQVACLDVKPGKTPATKDNDYLWAHSYEREGIVSLRLGWVLGVEVSEETFDPAELMAEWKEKEPEWNVPRDWSD